MLARFWLTPTPPVRSNRPGGATSAFRESDRRDLPEADERNGDHGIVRLAGAGRPLSRNALAGVVATRRSQGTGIRTMTRF